MTEDGSGERKVREYVVLRRFDMTKLATETKLAEAVPEDESLTGGTLELWEPLRSETAASAADAIKQAAKALNASESHGHDGLGLAEGDYKAVPMRSWRGTLRVKNEVRSVPLFEDLEKEAVPA